MELENQENALNGSEGQAVVETPPAESASPEQEHLDDQTAKPDEQGTEAETEDDGELKPWMKKRLARERVKAEREKQRADMLEMQLRGGYQPQYQQQPVNQQNQQQAIDPNQPLTEDAVMSLMEKADMRRRQQIEAQARQQAHESFMRRLNEGADKFEDFDDVVRDPSLPMTPVMVEAVLDISDPDTLLYSLAKDKRERLAEIARLPPAQQIREMGVLVAEHKLKTKPKLVSKAPAPPSTQPKSSAGSAAQPKPEDMSPEEYCGYLKQQRQSKSRR